MRNLMKRLAKLEKALRRNHDPDLRDRTISQALKYLSDEELISLEHISLASEEGTLPRELSQPELAAVDAYNVAVDLESVRTACVPPPRCETSCSKGA